MSNQSATNYRVRVTKDQLVFSAGHFITFDGNICERIHGHNWRVAIEVSGQLDENCYVFDFIAIRESAQQIVNDLDHRMLLPTRHPQIHVRTVPAGDRDGAFTVEEVETRFADRRWIFPREECVLLPVKNTTAELIADWIAGQLLENWGKEKTKTLCLLQVEVEENFGQWAICQRKLNQ